MRPRDIEMQGNVIATLRIGDDAHNSRRSFRLRGRGRTGFEGKRNPNARADFAGFAARDPNAIAGGVDGPGDFDSHAEAASPANTGWHAELRARMLAHLSECSGGELAHWGDILAVPPTNVKPTQYHL